MWQTYHDVNSLDQALALLAAKTEAGRPSGRARIVAGATDLLLDLQRRSDHNIEALIDITRVPGLDQIVLDDNGVIHIGPLVTHNQVVASDLLRRRALPLVQACWEVGAPQIRNRGTLAGNLITASPANDTIPPLLILAASIVLRSPRGERVLPLAEFYTGVRRTALQVDEILVDIRFSAMQPEQRGCFVKMGLRSAQAIALVSAAILLTLDGSRVAAASIALGSVAPTVIRAVQAEAALQDRLLDEEAIDLAAGLAQQAARPIDDIRASAVYRQEMTRVAVSRGLHALLSGETLSTLPEHPPLLWGKSSGQAPVLSGQANPRWSLPLLTFPGAPIVTRINGKEYTFTTGHHKSLLRLLREEAGLTGAKEGCAEGECGACTVFLDGVAVMSCLTPAPRAHAAEIVTIEGVGQNGLHPVQQAFIDQGAVQCGYCTPGFIMSAVKYLEENPHPDRQQIRQAIAGNLCRCTGYYSIVAAIEQAAARSLGD